MFDFTHLRKITNKMQVESLAYAKNFWQKIFDKINFDEDIPVKGFIEIAYFSLPDGADPLELFIGICLKISCSYTGDIKIKIEWDEEDESYDESCDQLLRDALVLNGFAMHRSDDNLYSCNINRN